VAPYVSDAKAEYVRLFIGAAANITKSGTRGVRNVSAASVSNRKARLIENRGGDYTEFERFDK
jgi:hypothetical protein